MARRKPEKYGRIVETSTVERDGITYQLHVVMQNGSIHSTWTCGKCYFTGRESTNRGDTLEMAMSFAEIGSHTHHALRHRAQPLDDGDSGRAAGPPPQR